MDLFNLLAQTSAAYAEETAETHAVTDALNYFWQQITTLGWLQAVFAVSFGVVYLMYGWRIFKALTVIAFALLGLYGGMWIGAQFDKVLLGSLLGLGILAVLSVPLMRWAVGILGAVAGGVLTASIWHALNLPEQYIWAGALIGFIAGGMIAFIVFRISVMLFTSLGGGALIIVGVLTLVYQYELMQQPPTQHLEDWYFNHNWFMPVLLIAATCFGMLLQYRFVKGEKNWTV